MVLAGHWLKYALLLGHYLEKLPRMVICLSFIILNLISFQHFKIFKTLNKVCFSYALLQYNFLENRTKVFYGLLKEPDIHVLPAPVEDEEEAEETPDKPKKKKAKKDNIFIKKPKSDPNAPPNDRIPLPEL